MTAVSTTVPVDVLVWTGSVLMALLISIIVLTVGRSLWSARHSTQRAHIRDRLRPMVFEFLETNEGAPDWHAELTNIERVVLRGLIKDMLEVVRGTERERLQQLGIASGLDDWAVNLLTSDGRYARLRGLTWLYRLEVAVDHDLIVEVCRPTPELRGAGARVLSTRPSAAQVGTTLLYRAGKPMTVLGVDTLYQFHKDDPTRLLAFARRNSWLWDDRLIAQTLHVLQECDPVGTDVSLEWITAQTGHEASEVRTAAVSALRHYGWRPDIRFGVDWDERLHDPSSSVRRMTYRVLGIWDDDHTTRLMTEALSNEPDLRTRAIAVETLDDQSGTSPKPAFLSNEPTAEPGPSTDRIEHSHSLK